MPILVHGSKELQSTPPQAALTQAVEVSTVPALNADETNALKAFLDGLEEGDVKTLLQDAVSCYQGLLNNQKQILADIAREHEHPAEQGHEHPAVQGHPESLPELQCLPSLAATGRNVNLPYNFLSNPNVQCDHGNHQSASTPQAP